MKRFLVSTIAAALSFGAVAPAFAYVTSNEHVEMQTSLHHDGRPSRRLIMTYFSGKYRPDLATLVAVRNGLKVQEGAEEAAAWMRSTAVHDNTGRMHLLRYKMAYLNLSRAVAHGNEVTELPDTLVQTGSEDGENHRPSRRTIQQEARRISAEQMAKFQ